MRDDDCYCHMDAGADDEPCARFRSESTSGRCDNCGHVEACHDERPRDEPEAEENANG